MTKAELLRILPGDEFHRLVNHHLKQGRLIEAELRRRLTEKKKK